MPVDSFGARLGDLISIYLPRLAAALLLVGAGLAAAPLAQRAARWLARGFQAKVSELLGRLAYSFVLVATVMLALTVLRIHTAAMVTLFGSLGLAVSLSLQDVARNFVASLYLRIERPFHVGDVLTVRSGTGVVEHIGLRTTLLRAEDGQEIFVPNVVVLSEVVTRARRRGGAAPGEV